MMMGTVRMIIAIGLIASASLGFLSCENKAAKEAEAARIEQEKQEAIQQALEEQKAEMQKQEQQAQEMRLHQQVEQERRVQEEQQNTSFAKFVGKYNFKKYPVINVKNNYTFTYEVLPDGRVICHETNKNKYIGTIKVVSENAFMIRPSHRLETFQEIEFCVYRNGEDKEVGHVERGDNINKIVFDIKENRAYRGGLEDYRNRDIGEVEYYIFTR